MLTACGGGGGGSNSNGSSQSNLTISDEPPSLERLTSTPFAISPSQGLQAVSFSIRIDGDTTLINEVVLDEVDEAGSVLSNRIVSLNDEGIGSDPRADDGVYTGTVDLQGIEGDVRYFQARLIQDENESVSNIYSFWVSECPQVAPSPDKDALLIDRDNNARVYNNQLVMTLALEQAPNLSEMESLANTVKGTIVGCVPLLRQYLVELNQPLETVNALKNTAQILSESKSISSVQLNPEVESQAFIGSEPNDSFYCKAGFTRGCQWYLPRVRAPEAWNVIGGGDETFGAAVIDFGFNCDHEDIDCGIVATTPDHIDHGTGVASLITATADNGDGIAGVAWNTRLLPFSLLRDNASEGGSQYKLSEQIIATLTESSSRIINISASANTDPNEQIKEALCAAIAQGRLIVAAAGNVANENCEADVYPARYNTIGQCDNGVDLQSGLLVVGASDFDNNLAEWNTSDGKVCSNRRHVDVFAPGKDIVTAGIDPRCEEGGVCNNNVYTNKNGTSFATPLVSGAALLLWSQSPNLRPAQIHDQIVSNASLLTQEENDLRIHTKDERMVGKRLLDIYWSLAAPERVSVQPASPSVREGCAGLDRERHIAAVTVIDPGKVNYTYTLQNTVPFRINENTGEIYPLTDPTQCDFDFDTAQRHELSVRVSGDDGTVFTETVVIDVLELPSLTSLSLNGVTLNQPFNPSRYEYAANVSYLTSHVSINADIIDPAQQIRVNGIAVESGQPSFPVSLTAHNDNPNEISISVMNAAGNAQSTYTVNIIRSTNTDIAYLKAPNTSDDQITIDAEDHFGYSLAADNTTLVVGVPGEGSTNSNPLDDTANNAGAVYVYDRNSDGDWSTPHYIKSPNPSADDRFGASVALSGNTLVVGAPSDASNTQMLADKNNNAADAGAIYIYSRSGSDWTFSHYLKSPNPEAGDHFGEAIAIYNNQIVIGAPLKDQTGQADAGVVYVAELNDNHWALQQTITATNPTTSSYFGRAVAINENHLAIGSPGTDADTVSNSGVVYLYQLQDMVWTQIQHIEAANADSGDGFGSVIALAGGTLAISALGEDSEFSIDPSDNTLNDAGAVYVFEYDQIDWQQTAFLKASTAGAGDAFGTSLSLSNNRLAVGAPNEDSLDSDNQNNDSNANINAGAVYFYDLLRSQENQSDYIKSPGVNPIQNLGTEQLFGSAIVLTGDRLVVGAPGEKSAFPNNSVDTSANKAGAVFSFK